MKAITIFKTTLLAAIVVATTIFLLTHATLLLVISLACLIYLVYMFFVDWDGYGNSYLKSNKKKR